MQTSMDTPVMVRLTDEQVLSKAQEMAAKVRYVKVLRRERREAYRGKTALIESELDAIELLADSIDAQQELRKQGQLKFGEEESMSRNAATEALANVERHAQGDEVPPGAPPLADRDDEEPAGGPEKTPTNPGEGGSDDDESEDEEDDDGDEPVEAADVYYPPGAHRDRAPATTTARRASRGPLRRASGRKKPAGRATKGKARR